MTRYDAILFDFDGVLVDSEPLHWECWRDVLAPVGVDLTWDAYAANCIGVPDTEMAGFVGASRFSEVLAAKRELLRRKAPGAALVTDAVRELLRGLTLPLAVVTSSSRVDVEPVLMAGEIHDCFDACIYRETVTRPKPDPEPYRMAAALLRARQPLVVEDSDSGVRSAAAAGFDCLRLPRAADLPALLRARLRD